jgi:hypothetical protein
MWKCTSEKATETERAVDPDNKDENTVMPSKKKRVVCESIFEMM